MDSSPWVSEISSYEARGRQFGAVYRIYKFLLYRFPYPFPYPLLVPVPVSVLLRSAVEKKNLSFKSGLHAACHALLQVVPLYVFLSCLIFFSTLHEIADFNKISFSCFFFFFGAFGKIRALQLLRLSSKMSKPARATLLSIEDLTIWNRHLRSGINETNTAFCNIVKAILKIHQIFEKFG